jgi:hypothetical protein
MLVLSPSHKDNWNTEKFKNLPMYAHMNNKRKKKKNLPRFAWLMAGFRARPSGSIEHTCLYMPSMYKVNLHVHKQSNASGKSWSLSWKENLGLLSLFQCIMRLFLSLFPFCIKVNKKQQRLMQNNTEGANLIKVHYMHVCNYNEIPLYN